MPLLCGGGAVGIHAGEVRSDDDAVAHPLAGIALSRELGRRQRHLGPGQRPVGQVGKNAQEDVALGDGFDQRGHAFAHAVDEVGAHGVAGIHEQVHHQHLAGHARHRVTAYFNVHRTAAAGHHARVQAVGESQYFLALRQDCADRQIHVRDLDDLDLADEDWRRGGGLIAATAARQLGRGAQRRDDRRFLHHQWHHVVAAVDEKIQPQPDRQAEYADDVLDHLVGAVDVQGGLAAGQFRQVGVREQAALVHGAHPLGG